MTTDERKVLAREKIIPLLDGMNINDALDVLEYVKGCIMDFTPVNVQFDQDA